MTGGLLAHAGGAHPAGALWHGLLPAVLLLLGGVLVAVRPVVSSRPLVRASAGACAPTPAGATADHERTVMTASGPPAPRASSRLRTAAGWMTTILAFPVAGLPAIALGGVDDPATALLGGAAAGLVVGAAQALAVPRSTGVGLPGWAAATAAGLGLGLAVGSTLVDHRTGLADLLVQGAATGLGVGLAQALVLRRVLDARAAGLWVVGALVLWPLGWAVTWAAGVTVEDQLAVFGATGALVFTAATGGLMALLTSHRRDRQA